MKTRLAALAAAALAAASALSGCGGPSASGASASGGSSSKTVVVGTSAPFEPWQFFESDGKTLTGIEPDLLHAIGKKVGINFEIKNVEFTGLVPGVQGGKYGAIASALGIYGGRIKALDWVPDGNLGYAIGSRAADAGKYTKVADLCGVKVGVGPAQKSTVDAYSANGDAAQGDTDDPWFGVCKSNPIKISVMDDDQVFIALKTNKVDAVMVPYLGGLDQANAAANKGLYSIAEPYNTIPQGIGISKANTDLGNKIAEGMKEIIADGEYQKIYAKYKSSFPANGFQPAQITADEAKLITE